MNKRMDKIPVPERLSDVFIDCMGQLRKEQRQKKKRKACYIALVTAAVLVCIIFFGAANPAIASKIPLIGNIFELVQDKVSYKGDYSKRAEQLVTEDTLNQQEPNGGITNSSYVKESNGTTITVSEIYHDYAAMYLTVQIYNENGISKEMWQYNEDTEFKALTLTSESTFDFYNQKVFENPSYIEGRYIDECTFIGVVRVDLNSLPVDIPETFSYVWKVSAIYDWNWIAITNNGVRWGSDEAESLIAKYGYIGEWEFRVDVNLNADECEITQINETNENGVGIARIIKTPYEITADIIIPDGKAQEDYYFVLCDANGHVLDVHGTTGSSYDVEGRDLSTVYVFLCDSIQYVDLLQYAFDEEYEEKKKEKSYARYLQDYALYSTVVHY